MSKAITIRMDIDQLVLFTSGEKEVKFCEMYPWTKYLPPGHDSLGEAVICNICRCFKL